jgi:hypothetical protein
MVADALRAAPEVAAPEATAVAVVALWRGLQMQFLCGESRSRMDVAHVLAIGRLLG